METKLADTHRAQRTGGLAVGIISIAVFLIFCVMIVGLIIMFEKDAADEQKNAQAQPAPEPTEDKIFSHEIFSRSLSADVKKMVVIGCSLEKMEKYIARQVEESGGTLEVIQITPPKVWNAEKKDCSICKNECLFCTVYYRNRQP